MKVLRSMVAILLAAIWLPVSSHAFLEHFELIHAVHADHDHDSHGSHEHDADNHDAADGRCLASSAKVQISKPLLPLALSWLATTLSANRADVDSAVCHVGPSPPGVAPPELSHRWQFSSRAALPVRAPSLVG